jgi:hypothetical protein
MKINPEVRSLLDRFAAEYPVPQGTPGEVHEENVREWTVMFAQQVAHDFPGKGYGVKRAGDGRPISKDSLAQVQKKGVLFAWDLLLGAGTGHPTIPEEPEFHDLTGTGQQFVAVEPVDYLGGSQPEPGPTPPQPIPPTPQPIPPPTSARTYNECLEAGRLCEAAFEEGQGKNQIYGELLAHLLWGYLLEGRTLEAIVDEARQRGKQEGG